jgi:hypothetical protein
MTPLDDLQTVELAFHRVWVTATVIYKLDIMASSADEAREIARDVWHGRNGRTMEDWDNYYGSQWDDVQQLEFDI